MSTTPPLTASLAIEVSSVGTANVAARPKGFVVREEVEFVIHDSCRYRTSRYSEEHKRYGQGGKLYGSDNDGSCNSEDMLPRVCIHTCKPCHGEKSHMSVHICSTPETQMRRLPTP